MKTRMPVALDRVAEYLGVAYLLGAVGYRLSSLFRAWVEPLAPLYFSLPGALAGSTLYSAWTGLRGRRQSATALVAWGAAGVVVAWVAQARWEASLPFLPPAGARGLDALGMDFYRLLCDLSGIVFLFSLFLAAWAPGARRRRPAGEPVGPPPPG